MKLLQIDDFKAQIEMTTLECNKFWFFLQHPKVDGEISLELLSINRDEEIPEYECIIPTWSNGIIPVARKLK